MQPRKFDIQDEALLHTGAVCQCYNCTKHKSSSVIAKYHALTRPSGDSNLVEWKVQSPEPRFHIFLVAVERYVE